MCSCRERLIRLQSNLLQQRNKHRLVSITAVVTEGVFVQVGLQILATDRGVHSADSALYQAPESLNGLGVNVTHHIDFVFVLNAVMNVSVLWSRQAVIDRILIGVHDA